MTAVKMQRYMCSFYLNAGVVTVDGRDVRDLNPYWLRSHIGTVSQVRKPPEEKIRPYPTSIFTHFCV